MSFAFKTHQASPSRTGVYLDGRLDAQTYQEADRRFDDLLRNSPEMVTLVMDLGNLNYISSAGLRSIFRVRKTVTERNGMALLVNMQPQVRKVFDVVKAVPINEVFASEAELEGYLDSLQKRYREDNDGF